MPLGLVVLHAIAMGLLIVAAVLFAFCLLIAVMKISMHLFVKWLFSSKAV